MKVRIVDLQHMPPDVQRFFDDVGQEPIVIEREGRILSIVYPEVQYPYKATGLLRDSAGAWDSSLDVLRAIVGETP